MDDTDLGQLDTLVRRIGERTRVNERILEGNVAQVFLAPEHGLSEHELSLMTDMLAKLVGGIETRIRLDLADRLADLATPPTGLVELLADPDSQLAYPLLLRRGLLREARLVGCLKLRAREHLLAVLLRNVAVEDSEDAGGDESADAFLDGLPRGRDPVLASRVHDYVVQLGARVDRFGRPVLAWTDLPDSLASSLYWYTAAALRHGVAAWLADRAGADFGTLDALIEESSGIVFGHVSAERRDKPGGDRLVDWLFETGEITVDLLMTALRWGHVTLFGRAVDRLAGMADGTTRRFMLEPNGEAMVAVCRVVGFHRHQFEALCRLGGRSERSAQEGNGILQTSELLDMFDMTTDGIARRVLMSWKRHPEFQRAIAALAARPD